MGAYRPQTPCGSGAAPRILPRVFEAHPERFVRKAPPPPALPSAVWINPPPPTTMPRELEARLDRGEPEGDPEMGALLRPTGKSPSEDNQAPIVAAPQADDRSGQYQRPFLSPSSRTCSSEGGAH